ncbi:MAG: hypothetical protein DWQ34_05025 [Planctomycetota bacterium]|nr:MAG: hypothetical protein DWQ34_05025 [Planctomycetota bacterium]REK29244.1 MAG: hypothetical protein DWQ41_04655 [Planctomycetota bacterium]REK29428.1 MAG: hypothetical protein DWQ45_22945 [Planctomycetota bacterium]
MQHWRRQFVGACLAAVTWFNSPCGLAEHNAPQDRYFDETQAVTLFAFDDVSIPLTQNLRLEMNSPERHPENPVVQRGEAGTADSWAVQFYGSVIREGERFRMWYVAVGDDRLDPDSPRSSPWRVAYAESDDGVHWLKPNLGLVEAHGSRDNNLVRMEPRLGTVNVKVLRDPHDPDPRRRYKMGAHVWFPKNDVRLGTLAPYSSADGLSWKLMIDAEPVEAELPPDHLVIPALHFEPVGGLYYWDGLFHISGQNAIVAARPYHGRVVRTFVSRDFVNWSQASGISFVRTPQHMLLGPGRSREGEQTHEAISVWNRGNVLVGLSGVWHGAKEWSGVTVDLALVLSNDGYRFREALHEHVFMKRGEDGEWDQGGLLQGQGFENVGEQTYIYYGAWDPRNWQGSPPRGGVGIAMLPRDRFARLVVDERKTGNGNYQMPETVSELITRSMELDGDGPRRFYVNADGLGEDARLMVEILDHQLRPLAGLSGDDAAVMTESGFQTPVVWGDRGEIADLPDRVRLRVTFEGERKTDIGLSALYVRAGESG